MAPEQSRGKPCPASDQYSLAVMVYEWLAGRLPFQGASLEVMLQHRVDEPPSLQEFCSGVPILVEQVVMQALKKTPEERFKTVEQFAQALHTVFAVLSSTDLMTQSSDKPASNPLTAAPLQPTMPASPSPNPSISPLQTIWPTHSNEPPEHSSGSLRPLETPSAPPREMQAPQPQLQPAHSLLPPPAPVGTVVPHSHNRRLEGRTLVVTLLCLVLLVSLVGGGAWTFIKQRQLLNSQHATATAQAISFATATAAASAYNNAIATNGIQFGFDAQHTHYNPYEQVLTSSTVKRLVRVWTAQTGGFDPPTVANGVVYVGSGDHKLYAFKADGCGQASCAPLWTAQTGSSISVPPAVANGVVYVGPWDGKLYAFKADGCGQASCTPLWTAQIGGGAVYSSPAVANGVVYITNPSCYFDNKNNKTYPLGNKLYVFKADGCGQASCAPLWTAQTRGASDVFWHDSSPAVANGIVYVGSADGKLYAFKADGCGQASCTPLWTAQIGGGAVYSSPAVANGIVYVGYSELHAFKADGCGQASCAPLWTTQTGRWFGSPAVANGVVYVGSDDVGFDDGKLYAFHL